MAVLFHMFILGAVLASPLGTEMTTEIQQMMANYSTIESEIFTGFFIFSRGVLNDLNVFYPKQDDLNWAQNEPNNLNNNEQCITVNGNGEIADRPCDVPRPYICYRKDMKDPVNMECESIDPEYKLDNRTGSCYKFHTVPRTFDRAHFVCSAEGGHLAIINSEDESKVLKELFAKYPGTKMIGNFWKDCAFIGFHDWGEHGDWRTIHGQTLAEAGFDKFSVGEPNNSSAGEFCGGIYRNGLLNDVWCDRPAAFICEKNPHYPRLCSPCL